MARLPWGWPPWLATRLSESLVAGFGGGLFLGFSYTFWSQAITAEVYTLHLLMMGAAGGVAGLGGAAHGEAAARSMPSSRSASAITSAWCCCFRPFAPSS